MVVVHSLYREVGKIKIDEATCTQCGQCAKICPADVLCMEGERVQVCDDTPFGCIACGHCMMICPEGSIQVSGRGISPDDLVPLPSPEDRATADQLTALLRARRSVRHFKNRDVEPEVLDRIIEMATSAPMAIPPWDVGCVVVNGRGKVKDLADELIQGYKKFLKLFKPWFLMLLRPIIGKAAYEQFKHFIVPLGKQYVDSHREGRDTLFYDAPAVLIFHHSPYTDLADVTIACVYAMLAAESLGLGNTMIGGAPPVLQRNKALCRRLGIPEGNKPAISLILGYPAARFKRAVKRSFTHVNMVS